jgi:hypothetical protein
MDREDQSKKFTEKLSDTVISTYKEPVQVIDSFVAGTRRDYLNPFLYVFLSAVVLAFVVSFVISYPEMEVTPADPEQIEAMSEEMQDFRMDELQKIMEITGLILNTQFLGFMNILFIPVLALCSMLFFRESHPGFYRHLILNAYAVGQANVSLLLLVPVWMLFKGQLADPALHLYPSAFLIGLILLMTYNRYFFIDTVTDWLRAFSALIIGYFFFSLIAAFVVGVIAFVIYMAIAVGG